MTINLGFPVWELVGAAGGLLTMFGFYPQIFKMHQTKSVEDVSLATLVQYSIGIFLWLIYGMYLKNTILIVSNAVALVSFLAGLMLYHRYHR